MDIYNQQQGDVFLAHISIDRNAPSLSEELEVDRTAALEQLYLASYGSLRSVVFDTEPSLLSGDDESIMSQLANALVTYEGPLTQESFEQWASGFVERQAANFAFVQSIFNKHRAFIQAAIRYGLKTRSQDWAIEIQDVESEVMLLIHQYADSLSQPGTASLRNRLKALIKEHCWMMHIKPQKRRFEIARDFKQNLSIEGCEVLTDAEIASMRFDELEPDYCPVPTGTDEKPKKRSKSKRR